MRDSAPAGRRPGTCESARNQAAQAKDPNPGAGLGKRAGRQASGPGYRVRGTTPVTVVPSPLTLFTDRLPPTSAKAARILGIPRPAPAA